MGICECGCGQIKTSDRYRFVRGHNTRQKRPPIRIGKYEGEDVAHIPLTKGKWAIISLPDLPNLGIGWCYSSGYVIKNIRDANGRKCQISLHRFLMGSPAGQDIDHINGDPLDCRRSNMRVGSTHQNCSNQHPQKNRSSIYKGVSLNNLTGKYESYIKVHGTKHHLGLFSSEIEAARAYDVAAKNFFGEFAHLNNA